MSDELNIKGLVDRGSYDCNLIAPDGTVEHIGNMATLFKQVAFLMAWQKWAMFKLIGIQQGAVGDDSKEEQRRKFLACDASMPEPTPEGFGL